MTVNISSSSLRHYGVKGQQWGVRRGPPYPIDPKNPGDITIKKGTQFKRLSIHQENASKGHAYVTYLHDDVEHYKGFFGARLKAMNKFAASKETYLKRFIKYGDPYMNAPLAKIGKRLNKFLHKR